MSASSQTLPLGKSFQELFPRLANAAPASSSHTFSELYDKPTGEKYVRAIDLFQTSKQIPVIYEEIKGNIQGRLDSESSKRNLQTSTSAPQNPVSPPPIEPALPISGALTTTPESHPAEHPALATVPLKQGEPVKTDALKQRARDYDVHEHALPLQELAHTYVCHIDEADAGKSRGLTVKVAEDRLLKDGPNELTPPKTTPWYILLLHHFLNPFMVLLEVAGVLCFIAYALDTTQNVNLYLGIVLLCIVTITCLVSYFQEKAGADVMKSFSKLLPQSTRVVRDGVETRIAMNTVVVGDIVLVDAGDKIPADIRIILCNGLKVDNSPLTGENEPQQCTVGCTHENPLETHNLAFCGTLAVDGSARGLVVRTGTHTLIGQIADLASQTATAETTLHREVNRFVRFISFIAFVEGVIFLCIGFSIHLPLVTNMINVLGIIVANVPEGLPSTVTACLTVTARRLAKRNVFVKQLEYVETLGAITLIASDKTGTLTQNRMTVAHAWYNNEIFKSYDSGTLGRGVIEPANPTCSVLLRIGATCNRADFDRGSAGNMEKPIDQRLILGDASESALVRLCEKIEPVEQTRKKSPKVFEIPFNSANKWQLSVHKECPRGDPDAVDNPRQRTLLMKGAPEIIWAKCNSILIDGQTVPLDAVWTARFTEAYERLGSMGERCLGFAYLPLDPERFTPEFDGRYDKETVPMQGLTFVGLFSLLDPPREAVPFAVTQCKTAGIRVIMVTGDHPITAKAIARKVGIISGETREDVAARLGIPMSEVEESQVSAVVIHGLEQIPGLTDDDWHRILSKKDVVFARTSPQQKQIIVTRCQARGEIVAVTGDGVNDSPALKKADIGVAMGIVGSDVAKDSAKVILLDDNFASIVAGIEEGRVIFDNLKKSIAYTLSHLLPEIIPFLINVIVLVPLGLSSILILCIDLGTEMFPAVSLAYEPAESSVMRRPPRDPKRDHLVTGPLVMYSYLQIGVFETLACFLTYFAYFGAHGIMPDELVSTTNTYWQKNAPPFVTRSGKIIDSSMQSDLVFGVQAAWFVTIVLCQVVNYISSKTRFVSIFSHGLLANRQGLFALFMELLICVVLVYVPFLHPIFQSAFVDGWYWLSPLPFLAFIFVWTEIRKWAIRKFPSSRFAKGFTW